MTSADAPGRRTYVPAWDGLRGLAVAAVLLFHDGRLRGGFLGVDLFFALSGYLITSLLVDERVRTGGIRLGAFWERRARRLLPAVLVFLVVIVPLMWLWGSPAQLAAARSGVWPALLYVANWDQIRSSADYWALFTDPSPLTHLWSLAVEGQFYLVWPFVAFWCLRSRRWRTWLGAVAIGGFLASAVWMTVLYDPDNPTRVYMGTDARAFSILVGAVVCVLGVAGRVAGFAERRPAATATSQAVLLIVVVASWTRVDGASSAALYRGGLVLHSTACALLAASVEVRNVVNRALGAPPLRQLGIISYGLYLWHWPVFLVLDPERTGFDPAPLTLVRWAASIAVAVASYHLVETPIRSRRLLVPARPALAAVATSVAALAAVTVLVPRPDDEIARFDPSTIELPTTTPTAPTVPPTTPDLTSTVPAASTVPSSTPTSTVPSSTPTSTVSSSTPTSTVPSSPPTSTVPRRRIASVAWEGDSVAFDAAPGVLAALAAGGLEATAHTFLGVGLVAHDDVRPLDLFVAPLVDERPDVVVFMLSGWDDDRPGDVQRTSFARYADAVAELGATLVVLEPPPVDPTRHTADHSTMLAAARARAADRPDQVVVLDAATLWGPFRVDLNGDGAPERKPDGVHVCPAGAALLGHWLVHQLADHFDGVTPADPAVWAGLGWVDEPRYDDPPGACLPV